MYVGTRVEVTSSGWLSPCIALLSSLPSFEALAGEIVFAHLQYFAIFTPAIAHHSRLQFLIACSMQKQREGLVHFITWMTLCLLGRQRGGRGPQSKERISCTRSSFWTRSGTFLISWTFKTPALEAETTRPEAHFFNRGPLPLSVYLGRQTCDKMDQAFSLNFCILQVIKNWTVGRPGNEAKIFFLFALLSFPSWTQLTCVTVCKTVQHGTGH